jgi:DNA-binding winged helix-turn-helix (wHTH) protein
MKFTEGSAEIQVLRVADLTVDLQKRTVQRAGERLPVKGRSFQLLQSLLERYPETAGHRELMEGVWKGLVVTPDTLSQRVRLLRKALRDPGGDAGYIVSVHGQGYRLAHAPRSETQTAPASARPLAIKWAVLAFLVFLLVVVLINGAPHGIKHFFKHMFS